eukprot:3324276-Rhodomonas_salina.1
MVQRGQRGEGEGCCAWPSGCQKWNAFLQTLVQTRTVLSSMVQRQASFPHAVGGGANSSSLRVCMHVTETKEAQDSVGRVPSRVLHRAVRQNCS